MREIVHVQAGQCGNQIGAKVSCGFSCRGSAPHFEVSRSRDEIRIGSIQYLLNILVVILSSYALVLGSNL